MNIILEPGLWSLTAEVVARFRPKLCAVDCNASFGTTSRTEVTCSLSSLSGSTFASTERQISWSFYGIPARYSGVHSRSYLQLFLHRKLCSAENNTVLHIASQPVWPVKRGIDNWLDVYLLRGEYDTHNREQVREGSHTKNETGDELWWNWAKSGEMWWNA